MPGSNQYYLNNPKIHKDRKVTNASEWVQQFDCSDLKPLIICRGPIRKETMDVFDEMGVHGYGILLSEKDSITYTNALAPELRKLTDPSRVHRVPDYTGASKEERIQRIEQIIRIAHDNGYNAIFAGYGFMAEDEEMVSSMERAGLNFIGPCSKTVHDAGLKDEAKRTALRVGVSVTPGIDNATTLTLLETYPNATTLINLCDEKNLTIDAALLQEVTDLHALAEAVLTASYQKGIDLFSIEELAAVVQQQVVSMYSDYPRNRIRLKAISGGGGKGQRILAAPADYSGTLEEQVKAAAEKTPSLVREILAEVKCNGVGDNKNVLVELNIETTRHQEIQVVGNGDWCITMGGRDCSLQMHEQKLLEVSVTQEELQQAIADSSVAEEKQTLENDLEILQSMEDEASRFGAAVGLDSVSTFESIVDGSSHFFMEMNTRIQVEHRVTELCYKLRFSNPQDTNDYFDVDSLVEAMVLLARHGKSLPKPLRLPREPSSVEARLNATNPALQPHAGGIIEHWSDASHGEIRDDQGICVHNPDTDMFMRYHLAGAYDSNIALLLTTGSNRMDTYQRLAEILRRTDLRGRDLATNLEFHYGLVNWFIGQNVNARPSTRFILPYLTAVGQLKQTSDQIDLEFAYMSLSAGHTQDKTGDSLAAYREVLARKQSLILRPLQILFSRPHALAGYLSLIHGNSNGRVNPICTLSNIYHYLHMDYEPGKPPAYVIWDHDNELLDDALGFYASLQEKLGVSEYSELNSALNADAPAGMDADLWLQARAAHAGYQAGMEILEILAYIAEQTDFNELKVNPDLSIQIPDALTDAELQTAMAKVLVPPPVAKSDEVIAVSGGMFYAREAPGMEAFVKEGVHFNEGDPLYIVEVMKMFNKVYAQFSGTVKKILIGQDGVIIKKGQPLFKVSPDEKIVFEPDEVIQARKRKNTGEFLARFELKEGAA